jgi:eukaryotic-like serine/threonine-protein kinase
MSPEQIEGRSLDSRSDIYSLGVTAYHMLAGQPPFTGDTPLAVAVQHLNVIPPPLATRRPDVPAGLSQTVERMIAKKPDDRFSDPTSLLVELNGVIAEGAKQGWATGLDYSALSHLLQAADQRSAATTRLDDLMKTTALVQPKRKSNRWLAAVVLGCALAGGTIAALTGPHSLWAGAQPGPPVQDSPWGQLYHAKQVDTEAAWRAVMTYFPQASAYYHNLAKQGLVYHYLNAQEYAKAIRPLQELAAQPDFQTFGIAGLVIAYAHLNEDEQAYDENQRLSANMRTALSQQSPEMAELLDGALDTLADRAL